jgi:hypothetical protein
MSIQGRLESAASRQSWRSGHQVADVCQVTGKRRAAVLDRDGCRTAAFGFDCRSTAKSELNGRIQSSDVLQFVEVGWAACGVTRRLMFKGGYRPEPARRQMFDSHATISQAVR